MSEVNPGPGLDDPKPRISTGLQYLLDLGPLLVFFLVNKFAPGEPIDRIVVAVGAFMAAMALAMLVNWRVAKHVTKLQLLSFILVLGFGAITIVLRDETFIKLKPTIFYLFGAIVLGIGVMMGKPLIKWLLGSSFEGVDDRGWMLFSRNWAFFFAAMACLNEVIWRNFSTDFWIGFKIWGVLPLTFLFSAANMPMLMRHGLVLEEKPE